MSILRSRQVRRRAREFLCFLLAWSLVLPWPLRQPARAADAPESPRVAREESPRKVPAKQDLAELARRLERLLPALEEARDGIPRETFDAAAVVDRVGNDPRKLFAWVRDETYLVPYRGILRDGAGVLMDRLGNSLDRALLLFALLRLAGEKKLQLAHAELSEKQAAELLERARPPGNNRSAGREMKEVAEQLESQARKYGVDPADLRKVMDRATLRAQRLAEQAVERSLEQSELIAERVRQSVKIPGVEEQVAAARARATAALRDHWWLQWHDGSGWVDLDPSLPAAEPGRSLFGVRASRTVRGDRLTEGLRDESHRLRIRVIIERWEDGRLVEYPVLTQSLLPSAYLGERIGVHHAPRGWPGELKLLEEKNPVARLRSVLLEQREWVPVLSVGTARVARFSFTDEGEINDTKLPGFVQNVLAGRQLARGLERGVKSAAEDIGNILGSGRIGSVGVRRAPEPESTAAPEASHAANGAQLTAEWIEYEIQAPGEEPRRIRRAVFDLLGPAVRRTARGGSLVPLPPIGAAERERRALALAGDVELLALPCQLSPEFVSHLGLSNLLENQDLVLQALRPAKEPAFEDLMEQLGKRKPLAPRLLSLALARGRWSLARGETYTDSLNLLSFFRRPVSAAAERLLVREGFDIIANRVAVRPGSAGNPFLLRLEQGVVDTNAEALLLGRVKAPENTAEIFLRSGKQRIPWVVVRGRDDPEWSRVDVSPDVRERIGKDLDAGHVALVPRRGVELEGRRVFGWWRVDPLTGETLGCMESGAGQSASEYVALYVLVAVPSVIVSAIAFVACMGGPSEVQRRFSQPLDARAVACLGCAFVAGLLTAINMFVGMLWGFGVGLAFFAVRSLITGGICFAASTLP